MGIHQPRRPVSEAEIADAQKVFGDLLDRLNHTSGEFNGSSKGEPEQKSAPRRTGLFGWLEQNVGTGVNFFNLSPVEQGRTLATLDDQIRITVARKIADGVSEKDLREEFEVALSQIEPHISPADAGSLLRVMDEAVSEAQKQFFPKQQP